MDTKQQLVAILNGEVDPKWLEKNWIRPANQVKLYCEYRETFVEVAPYMKSICDDVAVFIIERHDEECLPFLFKQTLKKETQLLLVEEWSDVVAEYLQQLSFYCGCEMFLHKSAEAAYASMLKYEENVPAIPMKYDWCLC